MNLCEPLAAKAAQRTYGLKGAIALITLNMNALKIGFAVPQFLSESEFFNR
jgi:hypothetical protein